MNYRGSIKAFARVGLLVLALCGGRVSSARAPLQSSPLIVVPNLVAYWMADTDNATTAFDSAGTSDGTFNSGAAATNASLSPIPPGNQKSFAFSQASNQYIDVVPTFSITGSFTISAWVHPTVDSAVQEGIVEWYDDNPSIANGFSFRLSAAEDLSFAVHNGTNVPGITSSPRHVPVGAWTQVAGVYDSVAKTQLIYHSDDLVNGYPDATTGSNVNPPTAVTTNSLHIGRDYGINSFNGNIDEIRIYNRALSTPEVTVLKDGQPAPTGLMATPGNNQVALTWTAPVGTLPSTTYSVLRGTSTGNYTTVFNGISGTSYTDTTAVGGTQYFYVVVAVTVMQSPFSNEVNATPSNTPPPPPRTTKVGNDPDKCGCGTASPSGPGALLLGALLIAVLLTVVVPSWQKR